MIGFGGIGLFAVNRLLICLVGYESERVQTVIDSTEPSKVILAFGSVPTKRNFLEKNVLTAITIVASENYDLMEIDVSDPNKCKNILHNLISDFPHESEINIAPFSTKLSCIALWGLWLENQEIRILNSQPNVYNELGYSKGSNHPILFKVDWR